MAKDTEYWARRAERRAVDSQNRADAAQRAIRRAVKEAMRHLDAEAERMFSAYRLRYGLGEEDARAYLAQPIAYEEYARLLAETAGMQDGPAKREMQARMATGAYSYRMSRLERLRASIRAETGRVAQTVEQEATAALGDVAHTSERQTAYEQQMQTGGGPFAQMSRQALDTLLHTRWAGANYSERIWADRERLAKALETTIGGGLASGKSYRNIARGIAEQFGVANWKAMRLVRTEAAFVNNLTSLRELEKGGESKYKVLETLDKRTCKACGRMDGKVFAIAEAKLGVNAPPFHPNCRGCIVSAGAGKAGRKGQDADGNSVLLPGDMTYEEWDAWQKAGCPEHVDMFVKAHRALPEFTAADIMDWGEAEFATPELLNKHYHKHVAEYGSITPREYTELARELLAAQNTRDVLSLARSDGSISKYRISTNDFAIGTKEGNIRTAYRPLKGYQYWEEELERNGCN